MEIVRRRRDLVSDMHELLKQGVEVYRQELLDRVERDSSCYIKMLTTEPDYAAPRINDSYGLTILHGRHNETANYYKALLG